MLVLASAAFAPSSRRAPPVARAAALSHVPARAAARACVGALDELEGPFWDEFREFAGEEADELGLTVTSVAFERRTLSVLAEGGSVDELQQLNQRLSGFLDNAGGDTIESMPAFVLQVSSPGVSNTLSSDKDFAAFKGFDVTVTTNAEFKKKTKFEGTLIGRDAEFVTINLKGRLQKIPIELVEAVRLPTAQTEAGDPYN